MESLSNNSLRHIFPEQRLKILEMYNNGDFGAHTHAVKNFLESEKIDIKKMFLHAEDYIPNYEDLPNAGLANFFKLLSVLIRSTTAQVALALDAEEYCNSEANNITKNLSDIKQRLVWERSDELDIPFFD